MSNPSVTAPVVLIAAMSHDRVIGSKSGMPWSLPEEYDRYLATVRQGVVVMGRKSYEIFGADLDPHRCVVVTHREKWGSACVAPSVEGALRQAAVTGETIFVAGGASVYQQALPLADRMYLSVIDGDFQGDTWFPAFDPADWRIERQERQAGYSFFDYRRV
ncbi:dihydrofolate reductase [Botrimarina hoheduenensis]|uniref:dihydrofolate reductase n=1 Tax=Botrimarina hoheduenensis TaxID=2528000 RepID=A0A5C5VQC4_9BACT|nr:dihydrofolate reductase [Botrimarina hoheduenensis]TWT40794.1 Dihydrofolate reductase type 3 [Botrimarina hoheduenensis]